MMCGRLTATCPQSFEEINMRWHLKGHGSLARHQFIIVDSSYWPQWRMHLSSHGCTRMWHSYDVGGMKPLWGYPRFVGWNARKLHKAEVCGRWTSDGLVMNTCINECWHMWSEAFGAHIGDHTRKLFKIQAALSELRLVRHLIISWLKGWWSFTILCGYIFQIYT